MAKYQITSPDGGTYEVNAPDNATESEVMAYAQKNFASKPATPKPAAPSFGELLKREVIGSIPAQMGMGAIRGAGSIGATLIDQARAKLAAPAMSAVPENMRPSIAGGLSSAPSSPEMRQQMDQGLQSMGADPNSIAFGAGKLGAEIAGTAGIGSALALPFSGVPAVANALRTSGMVTGMNPATAGARVADMVLRSAAGGITGGTAAGMIDPNSAGTGAAIGAALPPALRLAGGLSSAAGAALRGTAPRATPETLDVAKKSMQAGYVIPPSMVDPSFKNRTMETMSGKFETAQLASTKNQAVTENLIRQSLGMPQNATLSQDALKAFRSQQYQSGYEPVKQVGIIPAGKAFNDALDDITKQYTGKGTIPAVQKNNITELVNSHKSVGFDSADAIDAIRILREDADGAFRAGDNALGKTYRAIAGAYEAAIDDSLQAIGRPDLLPAYREARKKIAQSGTVEKALREGAGIIDARIIGRELQKGKPLTGELRTVGEFGNVFNKAAQPPQLIGSPGVNNLKAGLASISAGVGGAAFGLPGIALGALNYAAPPVARSIMFSPAYQQGLLGGAAQAGGLLSGLEQPLLRVAPLIPAQ